MQVGGGVLSLTYNIATLSCHHIPLPRFKCESEGIDLPHHHIATSPHHHLFPSLASNTSRRGLIYHVATSPPIPLPHFKHELEGIDLPHHHVATSPPIPLPHFKCKSEGVFLFITSRPASLTSNTSQRGSFSNTPFPSLKCFLYYKINNYIIIINNIMTLVIK